MRKLLERAFGLYGREVMLTSGGTEKRVRAFFQGSNSKSWQNMQQVFGPLGEIPRGQYLCFLQPGTAAEGDGLEVAGKAYRICRVEDMVEYQWCLCTEKGGEDTWALTQ